MATGRKIQPLIPRSGRDFFSTEPSKPVMKLVKPPFQCAPIVLEQWVRVQRPKLEAEY
jgi:hypothetical protein